MPVRIVRQQGRRAVAVDGVVQSIEVRPGDVTPGYWSEMLPAEIGRRALILGHGGGTIAHLLLGISPAVQVTAVDDDRDVLALAAADPRFRLSCDRLRLVEGDAFVFAEDLVRTGERFDFVAVDLYRGAEMVAAVLSRSFLRHVQALLQPGGTAAFNLPRNGQTARRLRRIGQHFRMKAPIAIGLNCVVHCERPD